MVPGGHELPHPRVNLQTSNSEGSTDLWDLSRSTTSPAIFGASKPYWRQMIFRKKNILIEKNISLIYNDDSKKY